MTKRSLAYRLDNKLCRIHWWVHKHALLVCALCALVAVVSGVIAVQEVAAAYRRADFGISILINLALMIASSLIAAFTAPKPKDPEAITASAPVVKDGQGIKRIYGTVWIDDSIVIGWQQLGTNPIKSSGGKK